MVIVREVYFDSVYVVSAGLIQYWPIKTHNFSLNASVHA